jgi:hypothetical protein
LSSDAETARFPSGATDACQQAGGPTSATRRGLIVPRSPKGSYMSSRGSNPQ